jgi:hypothetical protein
MAGKKKFMKYLFFSLTVLVLITSSQINSMLPSGLAYTTEKNLFDCIEKAFERIAQVLTVSNDTLFKPKKSIEIHQFPLIFTSIQKQTFSIAQEVERKLKNQGLSFDNIQESKLYFFKSESGLLALKILKDNYPLLAAKTTLFHWKGKELDNKSEIFMTIRANPLSNTKKTARL